MDDPDTTWISEFENVDEPYKDFYREPVESISLYCLYVNRSRELFHINRATVHLEAGQLPKNMLIDLLKEHMNHDGKPFRPISLLRYNVDIAPEDVLNYVRQPETFNLMKAATSIESMAWKDSIPLFQSMNGLYVIFYEKWDSGHDNTRKIQLKARKLRRRRTRKRKPLKEPSSK